MKENEVGKRVLGGAIAVHRTLGPGLLESVYEECLVHEVEKAGLRCERQRSVPIIYDGRRLEPCLRLDLLVEETVVVEVKAVERIMPIHEAQLLSYLKLGAFKLGYLLNFNVPVMRDGMRRMVNRL